MRVRPFYNIRRRHRSGMYRTCYTAALNDANNVQDTGYETRECTAGAYNDQCTCAEPNPLLRDASSSTAYVGTDRYTNMLRGVYNPHRKQFGGRPVPTLLYDRNGFVAERITSAFIAVIRLSTALRRIITKDTVEWHRRFVCSCCCQSSQSLYPTTIHKRGRCYATLFICITVFFLFFLPLPWCRPSVVEIADLFSRKPICRKKKKIIRIRIIIKKKN